MYFILHPISSINHLVARLATDQITLFISIAFFIFLAFNYKQASWKKIDKSVSQWASTSKKGFLKKYSEDYAILGNAVFHILFSVVLCIIFLIAKHQFSTVFAILFTLIFSWGLNRLLKLIFKRERPGNIQEGIRKRLSYCFPSGHVMASISIYFFSAIVLQSLLPFIPWYIVALILSFLVVISRIYLNHHFFTDVLAGIACGIFSLHISIWFYFFTGLI